MTAKASRLGFTDAALTVLQWCVPANVVMHDDTAATVVMHGHTQVTVVIR